MRELQQTMLLVDDMELNIAILEELFKKDFRILKAEDGGQALKLLYQEKIDIVILDIVMPVISGFEVLGTMKKDPALSDIPVIIATSDAEGKEAKALTLGADDFITKPYQPVVVYKRVENILVKHVLEREKLKHALLESEEEFQSLTDSVPGGISVWKVTDKIAARYVNDGFCELVGYSREELSAWFMDDFSGLVHADDRMSVMEQLRNSSRIGQKVNMEHRIVRKDGEIRWVNLSAVHYKTEDGAPVYRAVDIDVTASKENELLVEQRNAELHFTLEHDALTDSYNRYGFCKKTAQLLALKPDQSYVLMQVDVERFKVINELYGIETGDRILHALAEGIREAAGEECISGRLEADHFIMCVPEQAERLEEIRRYLQDRMKAFGIKHQIHLYFGIYPVTDRSMSVELMCDRANLALQSIKGNYNQNFAVYDERLHRRVLLEQEFTNEMVWALKTGQFQVYYQPIFSFEKEQIVSAEALVRWIHPEKGMISPGDFIPFFERNGFIVKLDAYIREAVVKLQNQILRAGKRAVPISVNISRLELYDPDFCSSLIRLIEEEQIPPSMLRLEITESAYTDNPQQLLDAISILQKYGFQILMDDFGSGYSSLNMLKEVPVNILKLDMRFLAGQDTYGREASILASIIHMAQDIGITTVAEGVETKEQVGFLKKIACEYGQGYYYARPMPAEDFLNLLAGTTK